MELLISVTSDAGAQGPQAVAAGTDIAEQLQRVAVRRAGDLRVDVAAIAAHALISKDGKTGLIVAGITGGESEAQKHAKALTDQLVHDRDGVTVKRRR